MNTTELDSQVLENTREHQSLDPETVSRLPADAPAEPAPRRTPHAAVPPSTNPLIQPSNSPTILDPDGHALLDDLRALVQRYVVLPKCASETLALWILHTYAFECRDVTTYLGIESPEKRCGKTTLLSVLAKLVHRPVTAANISPSAFFRVIQETRPTLLIDEADTFLKRNDELRGILNAGYTRDTAFVMRVAQQPLWGPKPDHATRNTQHAPLPPSNNPLIHQSNSPSIQHFSCWCPKILAAIGRLPETLADRCIVIQMQRKTSEEQCERLRNLDPAGFKQRCARFAAGHAQSIR